MKTTKLSEFFNNEYVDQASYDNLRKIASLVDGQKNAARKVLHTILEKNIKQEIKVSQLGSKVSEFAEYLHGNLDGVIVNLAQDFSGTNNIPLLVREGNFGTRFSPEPSASRYIFTHGSKEFFDLFKKDDTPILKHQFFEGQQIEPMFFLPTMPVLLINGSEGVSSGFAQKILPRNPDNLGLYIQNKLQGKATRKNCFVPYFEGFKGTVEQGESDTQWLIKGVAEKTGVNRVKVSEVPVGYDLKGYIKILDALEEKKVIQGYRDRSEDDSFLFEVTVPSKMLKEWTDDQLLENLKLIRKVTENYTVINEDNKIEVFDTAKDILDKYIDIKLEYTTKRKTYMLEKMKEEIKLDYSKILFIKNIVDGKLKINKRKKDVIVKDLQKIDKIVEKDGSFDYLLNMNILSLTEERMKKLEEDIKTKTANLKELDKKTTEQIWMDDL